MPTGRLAPSYNKGSRTPACLRAPRGSKRRVSRRVRPFPRTETPLRFAFSLLERPEARRGLPAAAHSATQVVILSHKGH